jgi:ribosomal protein S18 acetylase RimI-like enzyme
VLEADEKNEKREPGTTGGKRGGNMKEFLVALHVAVVVLLVSAGAAQAQGWAPQKNVEIVVPVAPGGTNDKLARAIERTFVGGKVVNTSVSIVYKPGGGNQIGYAYMGQHPGDPHYLMMGTSTLITSHAMGQSTVSYADFSPIATIFNDYVVLTVNAASPLKTGKELITRMKANPQSMPLGFSSVVGNHHHIIAGLFMKKIGASPRDLKIVVESPGGDFVAFCGMFYEPAHRYAYVEPVATDPDYRRMGLGKAAVLEGIRRCGALGATVAYVGNDLPIYRAIGFKKAYDSECWLKYLSET